MDPAIKNLREWVALLFGLFCVLDVAGVQYGLILARTAAGHTNPVVGQIESITHGYGGAWKHFSMMPQQIHIFQALLAGAAITLLASLTLIVAHGVRRAALARRKR
jgi:hypothetical protein